MEEKKLRIAHLNSEGVYASQPTLVDVLIEEADFNINNRTKLGAFRFHGFYFLNETSLKSCEPGGQSRELLKQSFIHFGKGKLVTVTDEERLGKAVVPEQHAIVFYKPSDHKKQWVEMTVAQQKRPISRIHNTFEEHRERIHHSRLERGSSEADGCI